MINKHSIFFLFLSLATLVAIGQDLPSGEIEDAQIIIEKDKPLTLPKAARLHNRVEVISFASDTIDLKYSLSSPDFVAEPYESVIKTVEYKSENPNTGSGNFVKAGFGNYISPLIQAHYGLTKGKNSSHVWIDHVSYAKGPVRDEESAYSSSKLNLFGTYQVSDIQFEPAFNFRRESYYYYGYDAESLPLNTDQLLLDRASANSLGGSIRLGSSSKNDFNWSFSQSINNITMISESIVFNKELASLSQINLGYAFNNDLTASLVTSYQYLNYSSEVAQSRYVYQAKPSVKWGNGNLNLEGGVGFYLQKDTLSETSAHLFPIINASWDANENLRVFLSYSGGLGANQLADIQNRNRYLEDSLIFRNEINKVNLKAGLTLKVMDQLTIQPRVVYSLSQNKAFFTGSIVDTARYDIVYEDGNFGQFEIGANVSYLKGNSKFSFDMTFRSLQTETLAEAWYLPTSELQWRYDQRLGKEVNAYAKMMLLDGMVALNPTTNSTEEINTIADLGLGLNYRINEKFDAFLEANNLLNQQYVMYLNYPSRGITGKIGFIYRF
jgi:hypothetical protein